MMLTYVLLQVDAYYSLAYGSPRGNLRAFYRSVPAKSNLNVHVAKFRLKLRCEIQINWHVLSVNAIYFVVGKLFIF